MRFTAHGPGSTRGFERLRHPLPLDDRHGHRPQVAVRSASTRWSALRWSILFLRLPTGFLPTEDQGARAGPVPPSAGRDADPHASRSSAQVENYFAAARGEERRDRCSPSPAAAAAAAPAARTPARASSTSSTGDQRRGKENTADAIVASARRAPSAGCATRRCSCSCPARSAALASRTASPWSCRTAAG